MKRNIYIILFMSLCIGCTNKAKIKLNDSIVQFSSFPFTDSLKFTAISDHILEEPAKMLLYQDQIIINTFCRAKDKHNVIYSLPENQVVNEIIKYGEGPEEMLGCDIGLINNHAIMAKTRNTRKAYVNSYVTENYIYLLFSGCKRNEKNWAYGNELYVFSWEGKPEKQYILEQPIYTFAVDEEKQLLYSYSWQTEELIKSKI